MKGKGKKRILGLKNMTGEAFLFSFSFFTAFLYQIHILAVKNLLIFKSVSYFYPTESPAV